MMGVSGNWIDRLVGYVSPNAGCQRMQARFRLESLRNYEAAKLGRRTDGWKTTSGGAITATRSGLARVRDRSRDLCRNNPWAKRAKTVIRSNVVGSGIVPRISKSGKVSKQSKVDVEAVMAEWKAWGAKLTCDADGLLNFYGLQALVMAAVVESGECLIRRRWRYARDGIKAGFQLQVLEGDYLDETKDSLTPDKNGNIVIQGVQFDKKGRRVGYMMYNQHPGDMQSWKSGLTSDIVSADEIIHVFRVERPGQVRGIAWGAPVIIRLRDYDEYEDAQLMRQKIAALLSAFVRPGAGTSPMGVDSGGKNTPLTDTLEPGTITVLPADADITFSNPPDVSGYADYSKISLRAVAAGYDVPYEALTGDLENVNFSSGRMGWIEFQRNIEDWRFNMLIPHLCDRVFTWFLEGIDLAGVNTSGITAEWTAPRREMINPSEETKARRDAIRAGLMSPQEALREDGYDPDTVLGEYAEWNSKVDDLQLTFDSDPRKVAINGQVQQPVAADQNNGGNKP